MSPLYLILSLYPLWYCHCSSRGWFDIVCYINKVLHFYLCHYAFFSPYYTKALIIFYLQISVLITKKFHSINTMIIKLWFINLAFSSSSSKLSSSIVSFSLNCGFSARNVSSSARAARRAPCGYTVYPALLCNTWNSLSTRTAGYCWHTVG